MRKMLLVLSLVVLSSVLISCSNITGNAISSSSDCSDSDGGKFYNAAGTTTSKIGSFTDICKNSRTLLENYCRDGKRVTETIPCWQGCSEGACKPFLKKA